VSNFLSLLRMVVLRMLKMNMCRGTVSKGLLMSIAANVVIFSSVSLVLKSFKIICVRVETCAVVECWG